MGRLIDAETLKQELYQQWFMDILLTQTSSEDMFYALAQKIDQQPTAYDTDKVVEQLENERKFWENAYNRNLGKEKARSYSVHGERTAGPCQCKYGRFSELDRFSNKPWICELLAGFECKELRSCTEP